MFMTDYVFYCQPCFAVEVNIPFFMVANYKVAFEICQPVVANADFSLFFKKFEKFV